MKIFVSGNIHDLDNVRAIQQALTDAGHSITHDWTNKLNGDTMLSGREAKLKNIDESGLRAKKDILGVIDCDVYIICADNRVNGKGMYAELGAALALNEVNGKPDIYLIGSMEHMSVFYFHPAVKHVDSIETVIKLIGGQHFQPTVI